MILELVFHGIDYVRENCEDIIFSGVLWFIAFYLMGLITV